MNSSLPWAEYNYDYNYLEQPFTKIFRALTDSKTISGISGKSFGFTVHSDLNFMFRRKSLSYFLKPVGFIGDHWPEIFSI